VKGARRSARLLRILLLDGWRAAPGWMTAVTALLILGSISSTCYPLGYRLLVDGALEGDTGTAAWGVVLVAGLLALGWALTAIGATEAMTLSDRIAVYRTGQLVKLIGGVGGLEHLERHEYLANVEALNANRRQLAAAPRQLLSNVASLARIVALLVLLATVSPWLLLLPVSAIPPLLADRFAKRIARRADDDTAYPRRLAGMLFGLASDPAGAAEVRSYGLAGTLERRHAELTAAVDRRSLRGALGVLAVQSVGWTLYAACLMGAIAFVALDAVDAGTSLGTVLMAVSLIRRSRKQLASSTAGSGALISTLNTADRLLWLEDHAAAEREEAGTLPPPARLERGIEVRGVSFRYPSTEAEVLRDLDFELPAGQTVALVGENGSGKTTLAKLLLGMYRPEAGEILVDGTPLAALDLGAWRERSTAAFQDFARLQLPAVESIGVADLATRDDHDAAALALDRAGFADLPDQLPAGLSTRVGTAYTGGHNLSGGQWQRLALGRAMRRDRVLLTILDEPTASLDPVAEYTLFTRYAEGARRYAAETGGVTVLVSHRLSTARMADRIVYLDAGRVLEAGTHAELMSTGGRYAELFEIQAAAYR
jgi:ATP-binding cassette, subfamily B, bacterial